MLFLHLFRIYSKHMPTGAFSSVLCKSQVKERKALYMIDRVIFFFKLGFVKLYILIMIYLYFVALYLTFGV